MQTTIRYHQLFVSFVLGIFLNSPNLQAQVILCSNVYSSSAVQLHLRGSEIFGDFFGDQIFQEITIRPEAYALWTEMGLIVKPKDSSDLTFFNPPIAAMKFVLADLSPNGEWAVLYDPAAKRVIVGNTRLNLIAFDAPYSNKQIPTFAFLGNELLLEVDATLKLVNLYQLSEGKMASIDTLPLYSRSTEVPHGAWSIHFDSQRRTIYLSPEGISVSPAVKRFTLIGNRLRDGSRILINNSTGELFPDQYAPLVYQTRSDVEGLIHVGSGSRAESPTMESHIRSYSLQEGRPIADINFPGFQMHHFAVDPTGKQLAVFGKTLHRTELMIWELGPEGHLLHQKLTLDKPLQKARLRGQWMVDHLEWLTPTQLLIKEESNQNQYVIDTEKLDLGF